ncbi:hypothetical protein CW731_14635 [Polaribacter sp. ALD11]|uniref:T9SS type A sorting domain-containing protein n=1 Tax=Polaribacter sp. ALD11 TaxID=2058137 RepID=UPI000C3164B1|nr:T9SS type A sorting domain-containing protein [Polaribacter sp. ALD11]AUC86439.1 hypothetical protein CW731_14635 [Polaribacter sp. ALD11]
MKQKNFFKIAMLFVFAIITTNIFGQTTVSYNFSDGGAVTGLNEASPGITLDTNIGFGSFKNTGTSNPALNTGQLRLYQNATKGGSIIIYASNGVTITDVVINASSKTGPAGYTVDGGAQTNLSAGSTYTISGINSTSKVEFFQKDSSSGNRIYVDSFSVTYTSATIAPTIGFDTATSSETETNVTFTSSNIPITVSNYSGTQIDINVNVTGGTAAAADFIFTSPTALSFTADGSQNITFDIKDDADTDTETVIFTITESSSVTGLVISQSTHTVTITDDEAPVFMVEDFTNSAATASYADGSFLGNNAITWSYIQSRNEDSDANSAGIIGKALMLRDASNSSKVTSSIISGGIGDFSVKLYKGFTGSGNRQVELFINNISKGTSVIFDDADDKDAYTFTVDNINITGDIIIEIRNILTKQVIVDDISWTAFSSTVTWNGNDSSDWNTAANWDTNTIPTATDNVVIPDVATAPIIGATTGAVTNNLTITETDGLTINSGGSLKVSGASTGNVTYQVLANDTNWHLLSSPVIGATYDGTWISNNEIDVTNGTGTNIAIGTYTNTIDIDGDWVYATDAANSGAFTAGKGYSFKREGTTNGYISFTGTVKTDNLTSSITQDSNNWNLVGNPYSSYILVSDLISDNAANLTDTHEMVYIWNGTAYTALTGTDYIHPGQGFFVNAANSTADNFTIDASKLSNQTGVTLYKGSSTATITLSMNDGTSIKTTKVNYSDNKTTGLDPRFDVGTFTGEDTAFSVYTQLVSNNEGVDFMRQSLPNSNLESMIVPIGVNATIGKEITFSAEALNLPTELKVFLEDRLTNTFTRLDETNSKYKTTLTEALNGVGRFYLHTAQKTLSTEDVILNSVSIYKTNASTLKIAGLPQGKTSISLFNILGKEMMSTSFTSNGNKEISLSKLSSGIYLAKVKTEKGVISKKIILE